MKKINAEIIADSIDERGNRITSFILTYPRFIHSELMTHRMFSRNSASSRAIPFNKMVKMVEKDPFIPIAWQKDHSGMQGTEYFTNSEDIEELNQTQKFLAAKAVNRAKYIYNQGVTKQLCNRYLEPFMWHTVLVTATEFDNFFNLRCPQYIWEEPSGNPHVYKSKKDALKDIQWRGYDISDLLKYTDIDWLKINYSQAEIHIQALAESMWDAMNKSIPTLLLEGEWHIPFGDKIDPCKLAESVTNCKIINSSHNEFTESKIKIAIARCARLSYMTFEDKIDYEKDIRLHNQLLQSMHMSPFEHIARCMTKEEYNQFVKGWREEDKGFDWLSQKSLGWCNNFRGFIPYRYLIENNRKI